MARVDDFMKKKKKKKNKKDKNWLKIVKNTQDSSFTYNIVWKCYIKKDGLDLHKTPGPTCLPEQPPHSLKSKGWFNYVLNRKRQKYRINTKYTDKRAWVNSVDSLIVRETYSRLGHVFIKWQEVTG